jgi:XTP/dITP diphosphohydrolase
MLMKEIVFATNNAHKLEEISSILKDKFVLKNLTDIACFEDIPETGQTLKENALQKARYVFSKFGTDCFADDTGLEVEALNDAPGVFSARYAGEQRNAEDNMNLLLKNMVGIKNRNAAFKTVNALILDGKEYLFEGEVKGTI